MHFLKNISKKKIFYFILFYVLFIILYIGCRSHYIKTNNKEVETTVEETTTITEEALKDPFVEGAMTTIIPIDDSVIVSSEDKLAPELDESTEETKEKETIQKYKETKKNTKEETKEEIEEPKETDSTESNESKVESEEIVESTPEESTNLETTEETEETTEDDEWVSLGTFKITFYCDCRKCNGKWYGSPTASGTELTLGRTIAVDKRVISLGTEVKIEDWGTYVAEDTGVKGETIDIYVESHSKAYEYGVQYKEVWVKK